MARQSTTISFSLHASIKIYLSTDAEVFLVEGAALEGLGRFDEALKAYDQAIGLDPENTQPVIHSGEKGYKLDQHIRFSS